MQKKFLVALLTIALCIQVALPSFNVLAARTIYDNETGTQDGYNFELWKDYGTTSMTLNEAGTFSCQWSNIGNALFRKGVKFDSTKTYQQIGNINIEYGCDYKPNGNSYLCVYGWTEDPLVEYYIVESWGTWRPPGADRAKGQITVDGGTYDVYETTRVNQPSIHGNTTFQQYWSVRTSKRTSGTISVSEHFKAWERMGMKCGKLYEAALNVEGYQSSGSANVYKNIVTVGGNSNSGGNTSGGNTTPATGNKIECEDMTVSGQYAGGINNPFDGVALYANDESCSFTYDFKSDTGDFTLRGCSNNSNMAKVDLIIGGENKGTFYYGNEYPAQYTIEDVTHKTGKQKVELVINSDDGNWDAYTDYLLIDEKNVTTDSGNDSGNNGNDQGESDVVVSNGVKTECENMTLSGRYAGKIDSPFNGVALYANNDSVSFIQDFSEGTHDFILKGCSNNSNMAKVDLVIGGENKGTFYYGDGYPAEYTIENVNHKTGKQKVELIVNADDGNWDAYTDYLLIDEKNVTTDSGNDSGNNGNDQGESDVVVSNGVKTECENMTLSGRYAGKIDSPFNGVALYANNDSVSFIQDFSEGTHDFILKGCSNNSNMAKVDLVIGGENKGTFYYGDGYPAEYTIENVNHKTGKQKVELIVNADDGNWDAFLDCLLISGKNK